MCGIAGFVHPRPNPSDSEIIRAMASRLVHRGPDHEGLYQDTLCALASRRLAIIDQAGGNQPMQDAEHGQILVVNGEIYNFRELRAELTGLGHVFRTASDSEVLLAAHVHWGENCWARLDGMFGAAIWDQKRQRLTLARDRLGKKPLVYTVLADQTLVFASEIKALLRFPGVQAAMNPVAMDRMLDYGFNLAPSTFLDGIQQVMPGSILEYERGGLNARTYWRLDLEQPVADLSMAEAAEELEFRLTQAVRARLVADVPVAAYLSGGIDSSSVTALYAKLTDTPIHSLSITFEEAGYDERHFARLVSEHCGTIHHEFLCSIEEHEIADLIWHLETPLVTLLNLPLFLLSKQIRSMGFKVVLSGDGADEILGGYDYFKLQKLMAFIGRHETPARANLLRRLHPTLTPAQAWMHYLRLKAYPEVLPALPYRFQAFQLKSQLLSDAFLDRLVPRLDERAMDIPSVPDSRPLLDRALYLETRMRLPNLTLALADTMSMANSVELRSPFMDHHLVEFLFRIPHHYKMRGLNEKYLLKRCSRSFLPPEIPARRKQPLAPPGKWFVKKFRTMIGDVLSAETVRAKGYFRPEFTDHLLAEFDADGPVDFSGVLVVAFFVHLWDDLFLSKARPGC